MIAQFLYIWATVEAVRKLIRAQLALELLLHALQLGSHSGRREEVVLL